MNLQNIAVLHGLQTTNITPQLDATTLEKSVTVQLPITHVIEADGVRCTNNNSNLHMPDLVRSLKDSADASSVFFLDQSGGKLIVDNVDTDCPNLDPLAEEVQSLARDAEVSREGDVLKISGGMHSVSVDSTTEGYGVKKKDKKKSYKESDIKECARFILSLLK